MDFTLRQVPRFASVKEDRFDDEVSHIDLGAHCDATISPELVKHAKRLLGFAQSILYIFFAATAFGYYTA